jgi:hypothetical protein
LAKEVPKSEHGMKQAQAAAHIPPRQSTDTDKVGREALKPQPGNNDATIHTRNPRCSRWRQTTYDLGWFPVAVSAFAALGTFGNFALNLGIHFKWW